MINVPMWIATVVVAVVLVFLFTNILQRRTTHQNAFRICSMINKRSSCSINSGVCVHVELNSRKRRHDIPSFLLAPTNPHCLFQPATNDSLYNLPFASQTVLLFAICKSTEEKVGILRMNFFGRERRPLTNIPFHILFDMLYVPSAHRGQQIARTLLQTAAKVVEQYMTVKSIDSSMIYFTGNFSSTGNPTEIEYQWSLLTTPPLERDDLRCVLNSLFEQKISISKSSASFILRKIPVLYRNNTPCLAVEWHPWTKGTTGTTETAIVLSGNPSLFVSTMEAAETLLGMSAASPFVLVIPVLDMANTSFLTPSCADGFQVFCSEHISLFSFGRATSFKLEEFIGETAHGGFYLPSYV